MFWPFFGVIAIAANFLKLANGVFFGWKHIRSSKKPDFYLKETFILEQLNEEVVPGK